MIIWANRMYPKHRILVMGGKEPAMPGMLSETVSEPLRPEAVTYHNVVYAPSFAEGAQYRNQTYAPYLAGDSNTSNHVTAMGNTTNVNRNHSEVYAPRTVMGNTATHNSRVSTEYGDSEQVQNITYHTAVQVEMKNYNQIHGEQDMVRLAETLSDALYAALQSGGEGVGH